LERHIGIAFFHAARFWICLTTSQIIKDLNRAGGVSELGFARRVEFAWRCAATHPELLPRVKTQNSYYATNGTLPKIYALYWVALYTRRLIGSQKSLNHVNGRK
jgi:hypothetical protein